MSADPTLDLGGLHCEWRSEGLRGKLRARIINDVNALDDCDLLQFIIQMACPEMKFSLARETAKAACEEFSSFGRVLHQGKNRLVEIQSLNSRAADAIAVVKTAALRLLKTQAVGASRSNSLKATKEYLYALLAWQAVETFCVIFLNKRKHVISFEIFTTGTVNHCPVYPREVTASAMRVSARHVVLIHNHPSGDPTPSRDDVVMTRQIVQALEATGILLEDHWIFGSTGSCSFRDSGLL